MFFYILLGLLTIAFFIKTKPTLHSNWNILLEGNHTSTQEFYELLKKDLESNGVEGITIEQTDIPIGNFISKRRKYLRVRWKEFTYDCCVAPFGNGTFVSWWLYSEKRGIESVIAQAPFVGNFLSSAIFPVTYYSHDTASMFMTYAQDSVMKVIDEVTKEKGNRKLDISERTPIINDVLRR